MEGKRQTDCDDHHLCQDSSGGRSYTLKHCSTSLFQTQHIKIMKVALALAIIRQKPRDVSAREYTERLAVQFSQLQVDWKEKAQQLQQELLRTKQELARYQVEAEMIDNHTHTKDIQWSDTDYLSSGYSSSSIQTASQERDQLLTGSEQQTGSNVDKVDRIAAHIKFLSSVSSALDARHKLSILTESDLRITVKDTIVQATRGTRDLTEVLSKSHLPNLPPSSKHLETATQTIVDAAQATRMQPFHTEMTDVCNDLLKTVTDRISRHQDTMADSEMLCSLVCILSSIPSLYCHAVQQLISTVLDCAEMLCKSTTDVGLLDVGVVENVSAVFRTLEVLFTKYDTSILPQQLCLELYGELERSILGVTTAYPLFTFSVWRILAHLVPTTNT